MKKKSIMLHAYKHIEAFNGKFIDCVDVREVEVMCTSGRYAMVRRKGCYPYIADIKDLQAKP